MADTIPPSVRPLLTRLALVNDPKDPIWSGLMDLLEANKSVESDFLCAPALTDGEAHRGRGRLGMIIDLQQQLTELLKEAHSPEDSNSDGPPA